jgi:hypothetical protein
VSVNRTWNLIMPLTDIKAMKIFITGIKFRLLFQRLLKSDDRDVGHLPVHWRFVVGGSTIYNDCNQDTGVEGYNISGCAGGDLSTMESSGDIGVSCTNSGGGNGGSILLKRFQCEDHARIFKDTHGTLQPGYKTSYELELWVPIKKWLNKNQTSWLLEL